MNRSGSQLRTNPRIVPPELLLRFGYSPSGGIEFDNTAEVLRFSTTAPGGGAQLAALSIDTSQNVGIGTESPSSLLDVNGAFQATNIDGIIGANTPAAGTFTTVVASGIVSVDDTTESTSGTTGSMHTDGGLGVVKAMVVDGQVKINSGDMLFGSGNEQFRHRTQNTQNVSTTIAIGPSDIGGSYGLWCMVSGKEVGGSNRRFSDTLVFGNATVSVLSSLEVQNGSSPARTYTSSSSVLSLAMASATYDISVMIIQGPNPG